MNENGRIKGVEVIPVLAAHPAPVITECGDISLFFWDRSQLPLVGRDEGVTGT